MKTAFSFLASVAISGLLFGTAALAKTVNMTIFREGSSLSTQAYKVESQLNNADGSSANDWCANYDRMVQIRKSAIEKFAASGSDVSAANESGLATGAAKTLKQSYDRFDCDNVKSAGKSATPESCEEVTPDVFYAPKMISYEGGSPRASMEMVAPNSQLLGQKSGSEAPGSVPICNNALDSLGDLVLRGSQAAVSCGPSEGDSSGSASTVKWNGKNQSGYKWKSYTSFLICKYPNAPACIGGIQSKTDPNAKFSGSWTDGFNAPDGQTLGKRASATSFKSFKTAD
ncbi:MAG: hypothetical protein HY074_19350 [Deltaproteobacteria bacterium]|nr:hypothetical protein [Deltaproteobacteria bacterium]